MKNQTEHNIDNLYSQEFGNYEYSESNPDWKDVQIRMNSPSGFGFRLRTWRFLYPVILIGVLFIPAYFTRRDIDLDHLDSIRITEEPTVLSDIPADSFDSTEKQGVITKTFSNYHDVSETRTSSAAVIIDNNEKTVFPGMSDTLDTGEDKEIIVTYDDSTASAPKSALNKTYIESPVIVNKTVVKEKNAKLGRKKK